MNTTRNQPRSQQQGQNESGPSNRPFSEVKRFPLKAVLWENQTANGPMFSVQLVRVYKDEQNNWHETHSLNADDLLAAGKLLNDADTLIQQELTERRRQQQSTTSKK